MIENAHVQTARAQTLSEYEQGFWEGYEVNLNLLPAWYFEKPLYRLTARQRGYWFGREIRLSEIKEDRT
jgi:hypothetical protein